MNYAFIDHFQEIARAHFTVRRLERRYGKDAVRAAYSGRAGADDGARPGLRRIKSAAAVAVTMSLQLFPTNWSRRCHWGGHSAA